MKMEIDFFKPKELSGPCKITVHKTGKLGFSKAASDLMKLDKNGFCKIGKSPDEEKNNTLYMVVEDHKDEFSYKISKAGNYYYVKVKQLLTELGIDYRDQGQTVIYDVIQENDNSNKLFKLIKRVVNKKAKQT